MKMGVILRAVRRGRLRICGQCFQNFQKRIAKMGSLVAINETIEVVSVHGEYCEAIDRYVEDR